MNNKLSLQYLPLTILLLISLLSICLAALDKAVLNNQHYLGFSFVSASLLATLINNKAGKIVTFITLLLGTIDLIVFNTHVYVGFGFMGIPVQLFSFCILIVYVIVNKQMVRRTLFEIFKAREN